jgi:hypothetical protein
VKAQEVARLLSVTEFTIISSWLDLEYGNAAQKFEVLEVSRYVTGELNYVKVILMNHQVVRVTLELVKKARERYERENKYADGIA